MGIGYPRPIGKKAASVSRGDVGATRERSFGVTSRGFDIFPVVVDTSVCASARRLAVVLAALPFLLVTVSAALPPPDFALATSQSVPQPFCVSPRCVNRRQVLPATTYLPTERRKTRPCDAAPGPLWWCLCAGGWVGRTDALPRRWILFQCRPARCRLSVASV